MKAKIYLLTLLMGISLISAKPALKPLKEQLSSQLALSCQPGRHALKTISETTGTSETHTFPLLCQQEEKKEGEIRISLAAEVALASDYIHDSPYLHEFFAVSLEGNCTFATRKEERKKKTPLAYQIIERDPETGNILYWESHLVKDNLFVDEEYYLRVFFNIDGTYREHFLDITTSGKLAGGGISNRIHVELTGS